jgi:prepilin-type N-terminal cleavage/methylation domain-containing protein
MMGSRGITVIELIIVVAIVAILAAVGIAAFSKYHDSQAEAKGEVVQKKESDSSLKNRACTALVTKGEWKCTKDKQHIYFVHCEMSAIEGEKVTCRCFARVSLENICNPEIYFSLAEFNKKIAELKEDDASDEEDW